jgi:hypothetical protein
VTCNDHLKQGLEELHFTEEEREIKLVITALRNTHFITRIYWYIEGNTDLHKGDGIVKVAVIETLIYDYPYSGMKSSTGFGGCGGRRQRNRTDTIPVGSKILMFMLCTELIQCYIINSTESLALNVLYVYIHKVMNKV